MSKKKQKQTAQDICSVVAGMTEDDAVELIERGKFKYRILERDGKRGAVTRDYDPSRINLEIINDRVTGAHTG